MICHRVVCPGRGREKVGSPGWRRVLAGLVIGGIVLFSATLPAVAHRVTVFAWVEGDTVHVEAKFAGGKKVKKGKITVLDLQGNRLLQGRTDNKGEFSFMIPQKGALKIVLDAGMGHRAEWTLTSEDIQRPALEREGATAHKTGRREADRSPAEPRQGPGTAREDLQRAVEKALDKKLGPVMKILLESREERISLRDILGGIGYILGLMGIAAYFHYRRRSAHGGREKG